MNERRAAGETIPIFASLKFHDFRMLWIGLLVSNLGSWMQLTGTGYFIATLAGSAKTAALYLGFQGIARALPVVLLSPVGGLVADIFPRRKVLFITNIALALLALMLAVLTSLGHMSIVGLIVISSLNAAAQSFDSPVRQSWVPLMVDRQYVGNAIGLNSVAFNAPAVLGPAAAGVLIATIGVAGAFYVNAVATLAVVVALFFMAESAPSAKVREAFLPSIAQGLRFLFQHKILKWIVTAFILTALLVRPYSTLLPAFAVNVLQADAKGLGIAIAATGVGGFAGALLTAWLGGYERRGAIWLISGVVMSAGVFALGFVQRLWISLPVLFIIGTATLAFLGQSNTLIQTLSPDDVRGRAISVYTMVALGFVPAGALIVGAIASLTGLHEAFLIAGGVTTLFVVWMWIFRPILRTV